MTLLLNPAGMRGLVPADAPDVFDLRSDPVVQKYNSVPMKNICEAEVFIDEHNEMFDREDGFTWGITLKDQDRVIGGVGLFQWSLSNRAMLGYDLARVYWGRGIASEAVQEVIRFGFGPMRLNRIEAETIEDNHESRRMLDKLGFTLEGIRREYSLEDDGEYHGSAIYGLLRSEYHLTN